MYCCDRQIDRQIVQIIQQRALRRPYAKNAYASSCYMKSDVLSAVDFFFVYCLFYLQWCS